MTRRRYTVGKNTKITWCDHTFNPWWGCTKVSTGCEHCYAERQSARFGSWWGPIAERRFFGDKHWQEPVNWDKQAALDGAKRKVFCGSMCDVFEDRLDLITDQQKLFELIEKTPNLIWLLLTKRPINIGTMLPFKWSSWPALHNVLHDGTAMPLNVWMGITAETQEDFDKRWPILESIGREFHLPKLFVSIEPMLGPIDIVQNLVPDWVIVGGESGPGARPMKMEWAWSLYEQCKSARVAGQRIPFFIKQDAGIYPGLQGKIPDELWKVKEFPR
jgi:protein gp37